MSVESVSDAHLFTMAAASDTPAATTRHPHTLESDAGGGRVLAVDHTHNDPLLVQVVARFMRDGEARVSVVGLIKDAHGNKRTNLTIGTRTLFPEFVFKLNMLLYGIIAYTGFQPIAHSTLILAARDNAEPPETIHFCPLTATQPQKRKRSDLEGCDGDGGEDDEAIKAIIINFKSLSVRMVAGSVSNAGRIDFSRAHMEATA